MLKMRVYNTSLAQEWILHQPNLSGVFIGSKKLQQYSKKFKSPKFECTNGIIVDTM